MKKRVGLLLLIALTCAAVLAGCSDEGKNEAADNTATAAPTQAAAEPTKEPVKEIEKYTVTFYDTDGKTVIATNEVESGKTVEEFTPEKENRIFVGWFGTPTLAHEFDFTAAITADTSVFAGFMENVADTRTFAIVGSGMSPLLSESSWGKVISEKHYLEKSADANVYTITLDICAGDEFQFAIDTSWSNQRGGGYLKTTELDGTAYFIVSGGLSDNTKKANIKCLVDGNYTLTLTTYPGADVYDTENQYYTEETKGNYNSNPFDTIEWVYNGEMLEQTGDVSISYYIKGAKITNWEDRYDDIYGFVNDNGIHTLVINLEEGDEFLMTSLVTSNGADSVGNEYVRFSNIVDENSRSFVSGTESQNIIANATGKYTFTYNPETTELTVGFEAEQ